jgi:tRNA nucleotidyltransferase (CCA-adding enzyme)
MVVEGDAIKLVEQLQARYGGEFHTHRRFGTAKWFMTPAIWKAMEEAEIEGFEDLVIQSTSSSPPPHPPLPDVIDFVTARTEFYTEPSALPEVSRGSIKLDLHRRDFTINTLAVRLDGVHLGELLDFYSGRRDLELGLIRVLHSLSFVDDPTRILRAIRLEQRLGFRIEKRTAELLRTALPMLDRVTGDRIRHEIEQALREPDRTAVMERLAEVGVMAQIHPALHWSDEIASAFSRVSQEVEAPLWRGERPKRWLPFLYFSQWVASLSEPDQLAAMARLRVRKVTRDDVAALSRCLATIKNLPEAVRPSQVEKALRPFHPRVLLAARIAFGEGPEANLIARYYQEWRGVKTAVTGDDLRLLGLKPGPEFAVILDRLLAARLDGAISDEASERKLLTILVQELVK